jgi:hypothetical protein
MRKRTFASRFFLALSIVAPTFFLSAIAQAKPFVEVQRFESPVESRLDRDVEFSPNLDSKLGGFTGGTSPNENWSEASWAETSAEILEDNELRNTNQLDSIPSAVETFQNFNNINRLR